MGNITMYCKICNRLLGDIVINEKTTSIKIPLCKKCVESKKVLVDDEAKKKETERYIECLESILEEYGYYPTIPQIHAFEDFWHEYLYKQRIQGKVKN